MMAFPNMNKVFLIKVNTSNCGIKAMLMQESHSIAYIIKVLSLKNQPLSIYKKKCWLFCL